MHDPADMIELPNGKLGLAWWFDNDGIGPVGIRYRTLDAVTWQLDPDRLFVENGSAWSRPEPAAKDGKCEKATFRTDPTDFFKGNHPQCEDGLRCDGAKCVDAVMPPGRCAGTRDCDEGSYCAAAENNEPGTCAPRRPAGQPCHDVARDMFAPVRKGFCRRAQTEDVGVCVSFCGSG